MRKRIIEVGLVSRPAITDSVVDLTDPMRAAIGEAKTLNLDSAVPMGTPSAQVKVSPVGVASHGPSGDGRRCSGSLTARVLTAGCCRSGISRSLPTTGVGERFPLIGRPHRPGASHTADRCDETPAP
jgi:hypothetical protein